MAITDTTIAEPPKSKASTDLAAEGRELQALLTSDKLGARVIGLVLAVDEVRTFTGKNADGSAYVSHSRRIQVFAGPNAGAVICGERQERIEDFKQLNPGTFIDTQILGAKTDGKQMVFRIKL